MENSKRLHLSNETGLRGDEITRAAIIKQLEETGYCLLKGVVSAYTCNIVFSEFMDYMETLTKGRFKRDDKTTWTYQTETESNVPQHTRGLIQNYNVGFQPHAIRTRLAVKHVFEKLWETDDLVSSVDGTSFTFKGQKNRCDFSSLSDWEKKSWKKTAVHMDQTSEGFSCVQGGLAVTDQKRDEHCFVVVPGSHLHHTKMLEIGAKLLRKRNRQRKREGKKPVKAKPDWLLAEEKHMRFVAKRAGLKMARVEMEKGDFVLWDSRVLHSSERYCATADGDAIRLQVFACMKPRPFRDQPEAYAEQVAQRQKAYDNCQVTRHIPDSTTCFGVKPRLWSKKHMAWYASMEIPKSAEMNEEEKRLHMLS